MKSTQGPERTNVSEKHPNTEAQSAAFVFLWDAPLAGFELRGDLRSPLTQRWESVARNLRPSHATAGPWLVERQPRGLPRQVRRYAPLAIPGLHRQFAALDVARPERLRGFATKYGLLTNGEQLVDPGASGPQPPRAGPQHPRIGESVRVWQQEIPRIRRLLCLWDILRKAQDYGPSCESGLLPFIEWQEGPRRVLVKFEDESGSHSSFVAWEAQPAIGDGGRHSDALAQWQTGDLVGPAHYYVLDAVNEQLRGQASPAVLPFLHSELAIVPHTLLAALYVHFAGELCGRMPALKKCPQCERYFVPQRTDQIYCSASCRKKHSYHATKPRGERAP
jgi:hypothetical protein